MVLITGDKGFIGSNLAKVLPEADGMDLKDGANVSNGIKGDYNIIYHLASFMEGDRDCYKNNIASTKAVVEYCKKNKAYLVFTSSAAIYGNARCYPTPEIGGVSPINEYGRSKRDAEKLIVASRVDYAIFRLSNVSQSPNGVWSKFTEGGKTIYGDGTQVRDFIGVQDVVAYLKIAIKLRKYFPKAVLNLSSGTGLTINMVFDIINEEKVKPVYKKELTEEIKISILDNSKLHSIMGRIK